METPSTMSPGSIMPRYPWLLTSKLDTSSLSPRIAALRKVGVPYPPGYEQTARQELENQAAIVVENLKNGMVKAQPDKEIIALIAYLQRLGTDIKPPVPAPPPPAQQPSTTDVTPVADPARQVAQTSISTTR
jgi:cytochrome c oxidase cbb3-type subunit I/II